jgi:hypothetical protein
MPLNWPTFAEIRPHAQAAFPLGSPAMSCIADYLGLSGNYAAARLLQQQIAEASTRSLGAEHPDTLSARANLAYWTGLAGDAAAARCGQGRRAIEPGRGEHKVIVG